MKKMIIGATTLLILGGTVATATALTDDSVPVATVQTQDQERLQDGTCLTGDQDQIMLQTRDRDRDGTCDGTCPAGDQEQTQLQNRLQTQDRDGTCDGTGDGDQLRLREQTRTEAHVQDGSAAQNGVMVTERSQERQQNRSGS